MDIDRETVQRDLLTVFAKHGLLVGVGLTHEGVAIRSQDNRVDATNVGRLVPLDTAG